jgi:hypothetical protein
MQHSAIRFPHFYVSLRHRVVRHRPSDSHRVSSLDERLAQVNAHDIRKAALAQLKRRPADGAAYIEGNGRGPLPREVLQRIAVLLDENDTSLRKVYCFLYSAPESLLLPVQRGPAVVKCTTRPHHRMHSIVLLILKQVALWGDLHRPTFEAHAMLSMPYRSGAKY